MAGETLDNVLCQGLGQAVTRIRQDQLQERSAVRLGSTRGHAAADARGVVALEARVAAEAGHALKGIRPDHRPPGIAIGGRGHKIQKRLNTFPLEHFHVAARALGGAQRSGATFLLALLREVLLEAT